MTLYINVDGASCQNLYCTPNSRLCTAWRVKVLVTELNSTFHVRFLNYCCHSSRCAMDFGDLTDDQKIQEQLTKFNNSIRQLDEMLQNEMVINNGNIENITTKERADYNLFMAYSLNTLHWLHLRSLGIDPSKSEVKEQMNRIRQYMIDAKTAHERNTIRPHVNVEVARRFIQHGVERFSGENEPPAKRKRE